MVSKRPRVSPVEYALTRHRATSWRKARPGGGYGGFPVMIASSDFSDFGSGDVSHWKR